jgi:hypothetical protein
LEAAGPLFADLRAASLLWFRVWPEVMGRTLYRTGGDLYWLVICPLLFFPGRTVNVWGLLVPPAVATVTLRTVVAAAELIVNVAVKDVEFKTLTALPVTPVPLTVTVVAPEMKLVPVKVTVGEKPAMLEFGDTLVSVGAGGRTVNVCALLVPPAVVTVTLRAVVAAAESIMNVAVKDVPLETLTVFPVTPVPLIVTVVAPMMKLVPVKVTPGAAPTTPVFGETALRVGGAGRTVNVCEPLVPAAVVTVTPRAVVAAAGSIVNVAVKDVVVETLTAVPVTPVPLTVTVVAPEIKLVPVNVTVGEAPSAPEFGETELNVGGP